jgi:hypothetical protein
VQNYNKKTSHPRRKPIFFILFPFHALFQSPYLALSLFFPTFAPMRRTLTILFAAVLLFTCCATQQQRAERRALLRQSLQEAVASRRLHIDITSMNAMRYGSRTVTPDFFLELRGDTLHSYLPYLGQVQQAPLYSSPVGLNFEEPILRYTESRPKSGLVLLEVDVRTKEDTYHYYIEVYDTGESSVRVRSQHRDPISFEGIFQPGSQNHTTSGKQQ